MNNTPGYYANVDDFANLKRTLQDLIRQLSALSARQNKIENGLKQLDDTVKKILAEGG